jgi:hypothetical protein
MMTIPVVVLAGNGHHARQERSSCATGTVIMRDGSGHRE